MKETAYINWPLLMAKNYFASLVSITQLENQADSKITTQNKYSIAQCGFMGDKCIQENLLGSKRRD